MLKNKKETLRKIMNDKKAGAEMCQFFCGKNSELITYLHYNDIRVSSYNKYTQTSHLNKCLCSLKIQ